jgi:U3 small nucleolar RNA-associated protein 23
MPIQKYLDNTLHDECKPYITQCTLAKIQAEWEKHKERVGDKRKGGRPEWLPPPTEVPLRYCKHRDGEGNEVEAGKMGEERCLLDLLGGQVRGEQVVKNKQHYVLATADRDEGRREDAGGKGRKGPELRERARLIPGVPIVYVKRSVMILEELSGASEMVRRGEEREKFKEGLGLVDRKRKRGDGEADGVEIEDEMLRELLQEDEVQRPTARGLGRAKGPNPLSVKKKKTKHVVDGPNDAGAEEGKKKSTRRIRGKKKKAGGEAGTDVVAAEIDTAD